MKQEDNVIPTFEEHLMQRTKKSSERDAKQATNTY
jgi:hypothetical protein